MAHSPRLSQPQGHGLDRKIQTTSVHTVALEYTSYARIAVNNRFVDTLVDSGSSQTLASEEYVKSRGFVINPLQTGDPATLASANMSPLQVLGRVTLHLHFGTYAFPYTFFVVRDLSVKLLLGTDCLRHCRIILDYDKCQLRLPNNTTLPFV